jgi:hypothetical protein
MSRAAPGGALREGRFRPGALLSGRPRPRAVPAPVAARTPDAGEPGESGDLGAGPSIGDPIPLVPRARRRRRSARLLALPVVGSMAALAVVAWTVLGSPLGRVATLRSEGTSPPRAAARVPVVAVRGADGVRVFDATGDDLGTVRSAPAGVPVVLVEPAALTRPTLLAVLRVRRELPPALAGELAQIGATSPDGVWLRLRDGTRVEWGSPGEAEAKAQALAALRRTVPAGRRATVDVSAATAAAVSW